MTTLAAALLVGVAAGAAAPAGAAAQTGLLEGADVTRVRQRFGVRIPMRDGITLAADMWLPRAEGRYPAILVRTPYLRAKRQWADHGLAYASNGVVFLVQDARGRGDSEGTFDFFFADAEDGYDTIEWIRRQPWSNGRVGMLGGSYRATVQWLAAREGAPLTCIFPQAAAARYFDELPYLGGAFMMQWALTWMNGTSGRIGQGANQVHTDWDHVFAHRPLLTMDSVMGRVIPLYRDALRHSTVDDYWRRILFEDDDFRSIDVPAFTVTGWFDADQPGAIRYWEGMRDHSPAADRQHILIGPWSHGDTRTGGDAEIGEMEFSRESIVDIDALHRAWFEHCLENPDEPFDYPRARVYVMGANEWRDYDAYPPRAMEYRKLYLHSGGSANTLEGDGRLSWDAPGDEPPDRYTYDPRDPAPAGIGLDGSAGGDQRPVEARQDVLVYTTPPLDEPVEIIGRVFVELHAASDALDTDFTAKLVDVYPDGRALRLGAKEVGVIRARYREGYEREVPLVPGRPERYRIELFDIGHAFQPGHRIRLEISSSAFQFINPNQNTGNPVATDTDWNVARQTIFHDAEHPSFLHLPVMP